MILADPPPPRRSGLATWGLGLTGSVLANLALALTVLLSLQPQPVPDQDRPETTLDMTAQSLPRSEAVPSPAEGDPIPQSPADGDQIQSGQVPQSTAQPIPARPAPVASAPTEGQSLAPAAPADTPLAASTTSSPALVETTATGTALTAAAATARAATSVAPPAQQLSAQVSFGDRIETAARPSSDPVQISRPAAIPLVATDQAPAQPLTAVTAQTVALATATAPQSAPVPTQPPVPVALTPETAPTEALPDAALPTSPLADAAPAIHAAPLSQVSGTPASIRADLAFPAGTATTVDPQSLAAFRQFQDPGTEGAALRDGLAGLLATLPCARVQLSFDPDTATLELRGHLPANSMRAPVLAALQAEMGQDIVLADGMRLLPQPQCGALAGISEVGLPQSTDQITNPLLVGEDAHARVLSYAGGEQLFFDLTAPDYPAYVYVDYFDAGGTVLHLMPNTHVPLSRAAPKSRLRVGAQEATDPGLMITVGPPYGQEIAVAFAASHPLFADDAPRTLQEPAAPYLAALKAAVAAARSRHPDFKGEWVYFLVTTQAP